MTIVNLWMGRVHLRLEVSRCWWRMRPWAKRLRPWDARSDRQWTGGLLGFKVWILLNWLPRIRRVAA